MQLLKDILDTVSGDHLVERAVIGAYVTVVEGQKTGMSTTFRDPCGTGAMNGVDGAGILNGTALRTLTERCLSSSLIEASLGMAALNALLPDPVDGFVELKAQDLILEHGRNRKVAVVGEFPFLHRLRPHLKSLDLIQALPHQGDLGVEKAKAIFPDMDVIAITGSAFINHTFQALLEIPNHAYIIVLGATTPLSPLLFQWGVDAVCGTIINDSEAAFWSAAQGAPFRRLAGTRRITWEKPGDSGEIL